MGLLNEEPCLPAFRGFARICVRKGRSLAWFDVKLPQSPDSIVVLVPSDCSDYKARIAELLHMDDTRGVKIAKDESRTFYDAGKAWTFVDRSDADVTLVCDGFVVERVGNVWKPALNNALGDGIRPGGSLWDFCREYVSLTASTPAVITEVLRPALTNTFMQYAARAKMRVPASVDATSGVQVLREALRHSACGGGPACDRRRRAGPLVLCHERCRAGSDGRAARLVHASA